MNFLFLAEQAQDISWIFSGIGTEILCSITSLIVGGVVGYKIGVKSKTKQKQRAGANSTQIQIGSVNNHNGKK